MRHHRSSYLTIIDRFFGKKIERAIYKIWEKNNIRNYIFNLVDYHQCGIGRVSLFIYDSGLISFIINFFHISSVKCRFILYFAKDMKYSITLSFDLTESRYGISNILDKIYMYCLEKDFCILYYFFHDGSKHLIQQLHKNGDWEIIVFHYVLLYPITKDKH